MKYHHLTESERYQIEAGILLGISISEIARLVGKSQRGTPLKKKFWDARPFSRVVSFAKKEFSAIKTYLLRNTLEAIGWIKYISRESRLPKEMRQVLDSASASSA